MMNHFEQLTKIIEACGDGFKLLVNEHRMRKTPIPLKNFMVEIGCYGMPDRDKLIELDNIVRIQLFIPGEVMLTQIVDYDLTQAIEEAYHYLKNEGKIQ